jgi:hypothetical protein
MRNRMTLSTSTLLVATSIVLSGCIETQPTDNYGSSNNQFIIVDNEPKEPRTNVDITIDGYTINSGEIGGVDVWECKERFGSKVLLTLGHLKTEDVEVFGFILFEDGNDGSLTLTFREGLNRMWAWDDKMEMSKLQSEERLQEGFSYKFVVEPDGTGLYYNFNTDDRVKPSSVFQCERTRWE